METDKQTWQDYRRAGHKALKCLDFSAAIEKYGEAIDELQRQINWEEATNDDTTDLKTALAQLRCNRAACYTHQGGLDNALDEASKASEIRPEWYTPRLRAVEALAAKARQEEQLVERVSPTKVISRSKSLSVDIGQPPGTSHAPSFGIGKHVLEREIEALKELIEVTYYHESALEPHDRHISSIMGKAWQMGLSEEHYIDARRLKWNMPLQLALAHPDVLYLMRKTRFFDSNVGLKSLQQALMGAHNPILTSWLNQTMTCSLRVSTSSAKQAFICMF